MSILQIGLFVLSGVSALVIAFLLSYAAHYEWGLSGVAGCATHRQLGGARIIRQKLAEAVITAAPRSSGTAFGRSLCHRRFARALPSGIPMQVVVPSVSRAAALQGTAPTVFVEMLSGATLSKPGPVSISGKAAGCQ